MFTKYNNVNIPKNYSGNRFKQAGEDTEMKTHRAPVSNNVTGGVKTSVSPFFQTQINSDTVLSSENDYNENGEDNINDLTEEIAEAIDAPIDKATIDNSNTPLKSGEENKLLQLFKNVKNDDLLLLVLILLIANENSESSTEALVILALLLMYH